MAKYTVNLILCSDGTVLVPEGTRYGTYFGFVPNAVDGRRIEWETKDPTRVADYLVEITHTTLFSLQYPHWLKQTHPIGQQPEGSVMVPGSEKEVTE